MVEYWDDDERSLCKMPYVHREHHSSDDEYVPVTRIMKEYFIEEKERLYASSYTESDNEEIYVEPYSEDSYYDDEDNSSDTYNDNNDDNNHDNNLDNNHDNNSNNSDSYNDDGYGKDNTSNVAKKKKSITDIIDDDVYKKFSYL